MPRSFDDTGMLRALFARSVARVPRLNTPQLRWKHAKEYELVNFEGVVDTRRTSQMPSFGMIVDMYIKPLHPEALPVPSSINPKVNSPCPNHTHPTNTCQRSSACTGAPQCCSPARR